MSKKSGKGKGKGSKIEFFEIPQEQDSRSDNSSAVEIGYLTSSILDYYESTGRTPLEDGEEWKKGTEHEPKSGTEVPSELDEEILKAFLFQIKKFQK